MLKTGPRRNPHAQPANRRSIGPDVCWQVSNAPRFTGGPGTGKSSAARALAGLYKDLGLLAYGHLIEIATALRVSY